MLSFDMFAKGLEKISELYFVYDFKKNIPHVTFY